MKISMGLLNNIDPIEDQVGYLEDKGNKKTEIWEKNEHIWKLVLVKLIFMKCDSKMYRNYGEKEIIKKIVK